MKIDTLQEFAKVWQDKITVHQEVHEYFCMRTDEEPNLKALRDYVERNQYGFGERSFYYMWKLIFDDLKENKLLKYSALEIGVHRGQIIALWQLLGFPNILGLSPMNSADGHEGRSYFQDVHHLCEYVEKLLGKSRKRIDIYQYYSQSINPILTGFKFGKQLSVLYIDGGHSYEEAWFDIRLYSELVTYGGYLVIDDSACNFKIPPGMFAGIPSVSAATDQLLPPHGNWPGAGKWMHIGNVVHNRIFKRVS